MRTYSALGRNVDGGRWQCAADWTGDAKASCAIDEACRMDVTLAGCVPVYSCAAPDAAYLSDPADCQNIPAGETCEAQCAPSQCISGGPLLFSCAPDALARYFRATSPFAVNLHVAFENTWGWVKIKPPGKGLF